MIERLAEALDRLAARGETVGYAELARRLGLDGPGRISVLGAALEALMARDAAEGRPFRAALCAGRISGGLPARGFFEAATRLGRYAGPFEGEVAAAFAMAERAAAMRAAGAAGPGPV